MRFFFNQSLLGKLREAQTRLGWGDEVTRRERAFLVSSGLGPVLYLTEDGRVLSDASDFDGPPLGEASDDEAVSTLVLAAKRFEIPELLELSPKAPAGASVCATCVGRRWVDQPTRMICYRCAGRGWSGWTDQLRQHVRDCRAARPIPEPSQLSPLALAEHRVQGGFLTSWIRQYGPQMLAERKLLLEERGQLGADPLIVFHGDPGCLAALQIILRGAPLRGDGRTLALLRDEYLDFRQRCSESVEFDLHVSSWSYFEPASAELLEQAQRIGKPIDPALSYRNHTNGTLWGPRCGLEVENLWSWDGQELVLIEEALAHKRF